MWPKRNIQLVATSSAPGIGGVRAILQGIQLEFTECEPMLESVPRELSQGWMERAFEDLISEPEESPPVTELVYWPGQREEELWRERMAARGIAHQSIQSLLHNILEDDVIIWISEGTALVDDYPLLWHILNEAGFEPTILWKTTGDGKWHCRRKQGFYWLMPESWLEGLMPRDSLGKYAVGDKETRGTWVIRENRIDFYRSYDRHDFVGHLPRWADPDEEQRVAQCIAKCLDLGVSWLDIQLALKSKINGMADNLRWNINDIEWNAGTCGEELSS